MPTRSHRTSDKPTPYQAGPESLAHLSALVYQARPSWDAGLVRIVLADLARRVDGSDLAVAAIRAACDPSIATPRAIGFRGRHWDDLGTAPEGTKGGPRCRTCGLVESRCVVRPGADDDHDFDPAP